MDYTQVTKQTNRQRRGNLTFKVLPSLKVTRHRCRGSYRESSFIDKVFISNLLTQSFTHPQSRPNLERTVGHETFTFRWTKFFLHRPPPAGSRTPVYPSFLVPKDHPSSSPGTEDTTGVGFLGSRLLTPNTNNLELNRRVSLFFLIT